jgi:hypothetical protein
VYVSLSGVCIVGLVCGAGLRHSWGDSLNDYTHHRRRDCHQRRVTAAERPKCAGGAFLSSLYHVL